MRREAEDDQEKKKIEDISNTMAQQKMTLWTEGKISRNEDCDDARTSTLTSMAPDDDNDWLSGSLFHWSKLVQDSVIFI